VQEKKHTVSATQTLSFLSFNSVATSATIALTFSGGNAILLVLAANLFAPRLKLLLCENRMFVQVREKRMSIEVTELEWESERLEIGGWFVIHDV
jgi:hypothetical protein